MSPQLLSKAYQQPTSKVFLQAHEELTYGQLIEKIELLTTLLADHGLVAGNSVLVAVRSPARFSEILFALLANGIGVNVTNPELTPREARQLIRHTRPDGLILDADLKAAWGLVPGNELPRILFTVMDKPKGGLLGRMLGGRKNQNSEESGEHYPDNLNGLLRSRPVEPEDLSLQAYVLNTSGTTSDPKSVVLSRRSALYTLSRRSEKYEVNQDSVILNVLSHTLGDGLGQGPLLAFYNGCTWVRPGNFQHSTLPSILDSIYTHRVTHFIAVPVMLSMILRLDDSYLDCFREDSLQFLLSTAAALPGDLWQQFEQASGQAVTNQYGLTECSVGIYNGPDAQSRKVGFAGKPYACEIRIVDDQGEDCDVGYPGSLWIRSESLMDGYLNNDQATAYAIVDGWLRTGDIAAQDEQGFIRIVGREKDMISFAGHSLDPGEIAEVVESHIDVEEAAVLGVARSDWGEIPVAFAVCGAGASATELDIIEFCRSNLVEYKLPREVVFVTELPRSANGKLRRKELLAHYESQAIEGQGDVPDRVAALAARCFRNAQPLKPDDNAATVQGWDSLAHMELILAIEREFGFRFSAREIMIIESYGGLVELVNEKYPA